MLVKIFHSRFIVTTLAIYFITTPVAVAQSQIDKISYEWNMPQKSYEQLCKPNDQSEEYSVISSGINPDYSILPVTFRIKVGIVNGALFGLHDENENQARFTYAYEPEFIWSAWKKHNLEQSRNVDLEEWISGVLETEKLTTSNRETNPLALDFAVGRNDGNLRWWQLKEYPGYMIADDFPAIADDFPAAWGPAVHNFVSDDTEFENDSVELATLCQLKRIESKKWLIGLPFEPDFLISKYKLPVEEFEHSTEESLTHFINEPYIVVTRDTLPLADSE